MFDVVVEVVAHLALPHGLANVSGSATPDLLMATATHAPSIPGAADPADSSGFLTWLRTFSTSPAAAGVLALGAAILAYVRVGHQLAESRRANNEIARKNNQDQWWDTLKWAYTEAKESAGTSLAGDGATFRTVAAVGILDSLNQDQEALTEQQRKAVRSILDMFGQSDRPEVQEAVAPIYEALGRESPTQHFRRELFDEIEKMALGSVKRQVTSYAGGRRFIWDGVVSGPNGNEVIVEGVNREGDAATRVIDRMTDYFKHDHETPVLVVTASRISSQAAELARASEQRILTVTWKPGESTVLLREKLLYLLTD